MPQGHWKRFFPGRRHAKTCKPGDRPLAMRNVPRGGGAGFAGGCCCACAFFLTLMPAARGRVPAAENSPMRHPRLTALAALLPACLVLDAHAAVELMAAELDPVVVTATRQATPLSALMADVTVIDREQIQRLGQGTITDLLGRQPGIQTSAYGGQGAATSFYVR